MNGILFLVNPAAGSGRAGEVWRSLRASRPGLDAGWVVLEADSRMARRRLTEALESAPSRIVVVGGDGSVRLAVDVLLGSGLPEPPPLGIVPAGTGSDLGRSLGIPRNPGAAMELAMRGDPVPLDAMELRGESGRRFAVNVISMGISGLVNEIVAKSPRRHAGSYLTGAIRALGRYRPLTCRVEANGKTVLQGDLLLLAAANAPTFGRGMRIAPSARWDDGLLDLIVVPGIPGWQLPWRLVQLYRGTHVHSRLVLERRVESIRVVPLEPFPAFDLDGDAVPSGEAEIRVRPGALRVIGAAVEPAGGD